MQKFFNDPAIHKFLVGFDSFFNAVDQSQNSWNNYPPFNIIKVDEDNYIVSLAATGFTSDEISVTQHKGEKPHILIEGKGIPIENAVAYKPEAYLHRGLSLKDFSKTILTGQYVNVKSVELENGILEIVLVRELPDEAKPKTFKIASKKK